MSLLSSATCPIYVGDEAGIVLVTVFSLCELNVHKQLKDNDKKKPPRWGVQRLPGPSHPRDQKLRPKHQRRKDQTRPSLPWIPSVAGGKNRDKKTALAPLVYIDIMVEPPLPNASPPSHKGAQRCSSVARGSMLLHHTEQPQLTEPAKQRPSLLCPA